MLRHAQFSVFLYDPSHYQKQLAVPSVLKYAAYTVCWYSLFFTNHMNTIAGRATEGGETASGSSMYSFS